MGLHQPETAEESRPVSHNSCNTRRSVQIQKTEVWCNFRTRNAQSTIQNILPTPEELNWWHRRVCGNSWGTRPSVAESSENVLRLNRTVSLCLNPDKCVFHASPSLWKRNRGQQRTKLKPWRRPRNRRAHRKSGVSSDFSTSTTGLLLTWSLDLNCWGSWHAERSVQTDRWTETGIEVAERRAF